MIDVRRYSKETRKEITSVINEQVKAKTVKEIGKKRLELFKLLRSVDYEYIKGFYQPKEHQFTRAYTRKLLNLRVYLTQRNESYHAIVKKNLSPYLQLSDVIKELCTHVRNLRALYNKRINNDRRQRPRIYDKFAFHETGLLLTHYAIEMVIEEQVVTKDMADAIEEGEEEVFEFNDDEGCQFDC